MRFVCEQGVALERISRLRCSRSGFAKRKYRLKVAPERPLKICECKPASQNTIELRNRVSKIVLCY